MGVPLSTKLLDNQFRHYYCVYIKHIVEASMARININVPEEVLDEISEVVQPRRRSRFITEAILRSLNELREKKLALEYEEAADEIRRINRELEGVVADGLD